MKKLLIVLAMAILFLLPVSVLASPFCVTDPYPPEVAVLKYTGLVDGVAFETAYGTFHPSGASVIYDLTGLNLGIPHTFSELRACNVAGCSEPAVSFQTPVRPNAPVNVRFVN